MKKKALFTTAKPPKPSMADGVHDVQIRAIAMKSGKYVHGNLSLSLTVRGAKVSAVMAAIRAALLGEEGK